MKTARQKNISLKRSRNPFNHGSPVKGEEFIGRQEIIDDILSFLRKENEFNFTVFGQRRIGKTSLLRKIQEAASSVEFTYPVYFNLQDKARAQLPLLLFEIAKRIVTTLELELEVRESDFEDSHASFNFKEGFIPALCGELGEKGQLVLLFDEFDVLGEIEDIEDDFISFMVSLVEVIQIKKYPLKFIFAVGRNYNDLDRQRFGRITKFGPQREISNFTPEETRKLLKNSSDGIIPFEEEAIHEMYILTSGHPYFTQCLAASSFDAAEKNKVPRVTRKIVRGQLIPAIKSYSSGVYWFWDSLPAGDQVVLYLMAVLKEENRPITEDTIREKASSLNAVYVLGNPGQILEKMARVKLIRNDRQGEYDFYVEFIRKWIVREISAAEIKKLIEQIRLLQKRSWAEALSNDREDRL